MAARSMLVGVLVAGLGSVILDGCIFGVEEVRDAGTSVDTGVLRDTGPQALLRFRVMDSHGCTVLGQFGCDVDRPLLTGIHETLNVAAASGAPSLPATLRFESSAPSVLVVQGSLEMGSGAGRSFYVDVRAQAAGAAVLRVLRTDGTLLGQVSLTVADPTRIDLDPEPGATVMLHPGGSLQLLATVRDAAGARLFANDGVRWRVADGAVAAVRRNLEGPTMVDDEEARIDALAAGSTTVTLTAGDVMRVLPVTVVP